MASGFLNTCGVSDFLRPADACGGFFNYGEDSNAVQSLVSAYDLGNPNVAWGTAATQVDRLGSGNTNTLFAAFLPGDIFGRIAFLQNLTGSFVVVLSGTWMPSFTNVSTSAWSAYYLFDDVIANSGQWMTFSLYGEDLAVDDPNTVQIDAYVMRGLSLNQVSIYQYATTSAATVPEPSSLLLGALALGALGATAARARRRRSSTDSAEAN